MPIMGPKEFRVKRKQTAIEMAVLLGISQGYLSKLENGSHKPSATVAERYRVLSGGRVRLQDFPAMQEAVK